MILSGCGILLIFSADHGGTQTLAPYPPFGLVTVMALVVAGYLTLLGIYNSAVLVSTSNTLRASIQRRAMESKLLGLIGQAEMEREIKRTVNQITQRNPSFEEQANLSLDFDEKALKKYLDFVTREISRKKKAL